MNTMDIQKIFHALSDLKRVAIIQYLKTGEKCACHIAEELQIAQSKLSYHMKILCQSGLVESWYVGKWTHYQISKEGSAMAIQVVKELVEIDDTNKMEGDGCICNNGK